MDYKNELNEKQYEAVTTSSQYVRVIAGAGSGKTRVLTYRLAYLIDELHFYPSQLVAITFTNKVAKEMRTRIQTLLPPELSKGMTISTFHGFCYRFLAQEGERLGYNTNICLCDEYDQKKIIQEVAKTEGYTKNDKIIKKTLNMISSYKCEGKTSDDMNEEYLKFSSEGATIKKFFKYYEKRLFEQKLLDFDDLLLKTVQIMEEFPEVRARWQRKYRSFLVDEFQDTNDIQYRLLKLFLTPETGLYVVGDPDQTIYTWRGAKSDIILFLERDFPSVSTIILNRNYRSTSSILEKANQLIQNNKNRMKKDLYTEVVGGEAVSYQVYPHENLEATDVCRQIKEEIRVHNRKYSDFAIIYRANYLSRAFEEKLGQFRIPYKLYGGTGFFEREEIKTAVAYLRFIVNKDDDAALDRVINFPKRGLGEIAVSKIKDYASLLHCSMLDVITTHLDAPELTLSLIQKSNLERLATTIKETLLALEDDSVLFGDACNKYFLQLGLYRAYEEDENSESRIENLHELVKMMIESVNNETEADEELGPMNLSRFLVSLSLISSQDEMEEGNHVSMMTIHTAKGLEFPVVFIVGVSEGVFPSARALADNPKAIEEERRLFYVGITRAKEMLYLSCNNGYSFTSGGNMVPSSFFNEIHCSFKRPGFTNGSSGVTLKPSDLKTNIPAVDSRTHIHETKKIKEIYTEGDTIVHDTYGRGTVIYVRDLIVKVLFDNDSYGTKMLMANHPMFRKVGD